MSWDADRYLQFSDERLRPALDLIGRLALPAPSRIVDLGCGAGNVTRVLRERWPQAALLGLDSSPEMLVRARLAVPEAAFIEGQVEAWQPEAPVDLLFSNAALHWVGDHETLFPRLVETLIPGGVLAIQMPGNFAAPSHSLIRKLAESRAWAARMGPVRMGAILGMADYHRLLAPRMTSLTLWETRYWQPLRGPSPVLDWLKGTTLLPYLAPLDEAGRAEFLAELDPLLRAAYPADKAGLCLFPFRRVFILARR